MQETINQRLKFLIESLGLSVRAFSTTLGAPASTTRNYLDKDTKPSSDYIERIVAHFEDVNLNWLVAGKGEPFLSNKSASGTTQTGNFNQAGSSNKQTIKGNKGNTGSIIGTNTNSGAANQNQGKANIFISHAHSDVAHLEALVEQLRSQLADKERIIQLLEKGK